MVAVTFAGVLVQCANYRTKEMRDRRRRRRRGAETNKWKEEQEEDEDERTEDNDKWVPTTIEGGQMSQPKHSQAQVEAMRVQAEQLRNEAQLPRKKISEASKDLIDYCEKEKVNDILVSGVSDSHNPFQEKKSCILL
uniref:Guanine nucleotide-binding protein subunit gamma n=1 Tax=Plectus sambesii TaxID=2011161 RepID=A0A914XJF4_9BILA